jgi:hypothetical protein
MRITNENNMSVDYSDRLKLTYVLWHIDPLLGNDGETNETTAGASLIHNSIEAVAKQRPARNNDSIVGSGVSYGSASGLHHSTDRVSAVQPRVQVGFNTFILAL